MSNKETGMTFHLTREQSEIARDWMLEKVSSEVGAIGGQFTFQFTNTTIGQVQKVVDEKTGEVLDLTNYEWW